MGWLHGNEWGCGEHLWLFLCSVLELGTGTTLLFLSATPGREGKTHPGQNPLSRLCHSFPSTLLILKAERKKNAALETQNTSENAARRD